MSFRQVIDQFWPIHWRQITRTPLPAKTYLEGEIGGMPVIFAAVSNQTIPFFIGATYRTSRGTVLRCSGLSDDKLMFTWVAGPETMGPLDLHGVELIP